MAAHCQGGLPFLIVQLPAGGLVVEQGGVWIDPAGREQEAGRFVGRIGGGFRRPVAERGCGRARGGLDGDGAVFGQGQAHSLGLGKGCRRCRKAAANFRRIGIKAEKSGGFEQPGQVYFQQGIAIFWLPEDGFDQGKGRGRMPEKIPFQQTFIPAIPGPGRNHPPPRSRSPFPRPASRPDRNYPEPRSGSGR